MRMQAELCGLIARDALLSVAEAGDRPGKVQKVRSKVGFTRRLAILMPEKALGGAINAQGWLQWPGRRLNVA